MIYFNDRTFSSMELYSNIELFRYLYSFSEEKQDKKRINGYIALQFKSASSAMIFGSTSTHNFTYTIQSRSIYVGTFYKLKNLCISEINNINGYVNKYHWFKYIYIQFNH